MLIRRLAAIAVMFTLLSSTSVLLAAQEEDRDPVALKGWRVAFEQTRGNVAVGNSRGNAERSISPSAQVTRGLAGDTSIIKEDLGQFTSVSPQGARALSLLVDPSQPSTLYAGTSGGIFKSTDAGESWGLVLDPVSRGIEETFPGGPVSAMTIDPAKPTTLYAGTQSGQVLKTIDGGANWTLLDQIHEKRPIWQLMVDPRPPERIYALTYENLLASTDGGASWRSLPGLPSAQTIFLTIALDPRQASGLYLGTTRGLFTTSDLGEHWLLILGGYINRVLVDPRDPATLYAARAPSDGGLASSRDSGKTWTIVAAGYTLDLVARPSSDTVYALTYSPMSPCCEETTLLATSDHGRQWKPLGTSLLFQTILAIDPVNGERFYAATRGDLFKSEDGGANWRPIHQGLNVPDVARVVVDSVRPSTLYAATAAGLTKSEDGGAHWKEPFSFSGSGLAIDPQEPSKIFAYGDAATIVSADGGDHWTSIHPGAHVREIAVDPSNSARVYAVFADGLARSTDGGSSWQPGTGALPLGYYGFDGATIAVSPASPETIYAAGGSGIVKSDDAGATWSIVLKLEDYGFQKLAVDPRTGSTIYALGYSKVLRSDDDGGEWTVIYTGEPRSGRLGGLALDPLEPSTLYLASPSGLLRSVDRGEHWTDFRQGLPTRFVNSVTVGPSGNVYAATSRGLFVNSRENETLLSVPAYKVSLRTYAGNFVSARNCGGTYLDANARIEDRCETFMLYDVNGGVLNDGDAIYIRSANGGFVTAEGGGSADGLAGVNANRAQAYAWETFIVHRVDGPGQIRSGESITVQSSGGFFVAAENGGTNGCSCDSRLHANRTAAGKWETFVLLFH